MKSKVEPAKPSPPVQKCVDCTVMDDVDMIVITDNSESVQKDQERSGKLQVLKSEFFSEWYSGNNRGTSTALFGKFSNRLQTDRKFTVNNGELEMVDYTAREDSLRHLRSDTGLTAEKVFFDYAYQLMKVPHDNAESTWGWNLDNPEINKAARLQYIENGNVGSTFMYSALDDLIQFVRENWAAQYGASWTERRIQLFVLTDAVFFHDDNINWRRSDKLACEGDEDRTSTPEAYQFSSSDMCALSQKLQDTFQGGVTVFPTNAKSFDLLTCKLGNQFATHVEQECGYGESHSPFMTPTAKFATLDELTEYVATGEESHSINDALCCKSGIIEVTTGSYKVALEKDYNDATCPKGSCYKQKVAGRFSSYPRLYFTNNAWVYQTSTLSWEVTSASSNGCCPKDAWGQFLSTSNLKISCVDLTPKVEEYSSEDSFSYSSFA